MLVAVHVHPVGIETARLPVVSDFVPGAVSAYTFDRMKDQLSRYFIPPTDVPKTLLPRLYVGAVDICAGKRHVFRDSQVDVEAIIASAAVPPLYQPVPKRTGDVESWYWDGLFATNPPVSEIVQGNEDIDHIDKPDLLLVIRINPTRKPAPPVTSARFFVTGRAPRPGRSPGNGSLQP